MRTAFELLGACERRVRIRKVGHEMCIVGGLEDPDGSVWDLTQRDSHGKRYLIMFSRRREVLWVSEVKTTRVKFTEGIVDLVLLARRFDLEDIQSIQKVISGRMSVC